jgi:hypothetical protein
MTFARATSSLIFLVAGAGTSFYLGDRLVLNKDLQTVTLIKTLHSSNNKLLQRTKAQ